MKQLLSQTNHIWILFRRFKRDIRGAITIDFVVITAALLLFAGAVLMQVKEGADESSKDVKKCMKIQGKLLSKDISYKKRLKRTQKRCGKL